MVLLPIFGQFHSCLLMDHCMDNSLCCFATSNTLLCLSFLGDDTDESHSHNLQMAFSRIYEVIGVTNVDRSINKWDELCLVRDFPISLPRLSSTSCADPDQPDLTSYRSIHSSSSSFNAALLHPNPLDSPQFFQITCRYDGAETRARGGSWSCWDELCGWIVESSRSVRGDSHRWVFLTSPTSLSTG